MTQEDIRKLKVGDRVRFVPDGVIGTIASVYEDRVEIAWDDGDEGWCYFTFSGVNLELVT